MRDLVSDLQALGTGGQIGRAVVIALQGSAPRRPGATLLVREDGALAGSVSGGCVEAAVAGEVLEAIRVGEPRIRRYGVSDEMAWSVGLACGGTIDILIEPRVTSIVRGVLDDPASAVVATVVAGAQPVGHAWLFKEDGGEAGPGEPDPALRIAAQETLRDHTSRVVVIGEDAEGTSYFLEAFPRRARILIVGAVQVAVALVPLAKQLGYYTIVSDGREGFLDPRRFPEADELIPGPPAAVFARTGIDAATCVCILSHDPKFDEPALELALRSPAAYIGAIGSRKTQAARRDRLTAAGFSGEDLARVHGPIGLDLGGREPADIALAILAEITMVRHGRRPA